MAQKEPIASLQIMSKKEALSLGLKLYFTGKACRSGHVCERYASNSMCVECKKVNTQNFKLRNPNKFSGYHKAYTSRNRESIAIRRKDYLARKLEADPEFKRKELLKSYGLSFEDFELMRSSQNNKCLGCLRSFDDQTPHVDHDHNTGQVRGLLCGPCNRGLGLLRDDPDVCDNLAAYLRGHNP